MVLQVRAAAAQSRWLMKAASRSERLSIGFAGRQQYQRLLGGRPACAALSSSSSCHRPAIWTQLRNESLIFDSGVGSNRWNGLQHASLSTSSGPIDVTVTRTDGNDDPQTADAPPPSSDPPQRPKSDDQVAEEHIMELQQTVSIHHRNAGYADALESSLELLAAANEHFGDAHPATASAQNNVGLMHKMVGSYEESRKAYHESLRIYGEVVGKDHASYAAALNNLGNLDRAQASSTDDEEEEEGDGEGNESGDGDGEDPAPKKSKMSAMERMQLNESAIEYFDEAYRIRSVELGSDHPHTVASRSNLGSAMAATVLAQRATIVKNAAADSVRAALRARKRGEEGGTDEGRSEEEEELIVRNAFAEAARIQPTKLTRRRWEAAAEHLRGAVQTAVENPRGETVSPLVLYKGGDSKESPLALKKDRSASKKDRIKAAKEQKRQKQVMTQSGAAVDEIAGRVTTLSAATAAQNLAVFLKNYSDLMRLAVSSDSGGEATAKERSDLDAMVCEARNLYQAALHVRSKLLPLHHPDVVATKFSFAELLEAGDKQGGDDAARANKLREEILSSYNVTERDSAN